jgi:hypothetical protein
VAIAAAPAPSRSQPPVATPGTTQEEFTLDTAAELAADEGGGSKIAGKSPWALAGRRLRRNYTALVCLGIFATAYVATALRLQYVVRPRLGGGQG